MFQKLKSFLADDALFLAILLILVGIGSFGLGRSSAFKEESINTPKNKSIQVVEAPAQPASVVASESEAVVVASRSGTKYHLPSCPGASQIKEANLIRFASIELAEAAGYTPAANCPGL